MGGTNPAYCFFRAHFYYCNSGTKTTFRQSLETSRWGKAVEGRVPFALSKDIGQTSKSAVPVPSAGPLYFVRRTACPRGAMIRYLGWQIQTLCDGRGLR